MAGCRQKIAFCMALLIVLFIGLSHWNDPSLAKDPDNPIKKTTYPLQVRAIYSQTRWGMPPSRPIIQGTLKEEFVHPERWVAYTDQNTPTPEVKRKEFRSVPTPLSLGGVYLDRTTAYLQGHVSQVIAHTQQQLEQEPRWDLVLRSHCDGRGEEGYSLILGLKRGKQVREFFNNLGIDPGRIDLISEGKHFSPCPNHTPECPADQARTRGTFRYMAIRESNFGCLVQLGIVAESTTPTETAQSLVRHQPYLHKVFIAER